MFTLPNLLSFLRLPLAMLFFLESPVFRSLAIVLAMISDGLDGYLARKYKQISPLGTWLDPITDKLFVLMALGVLLSEQKLALWQASSLMSRDFAILGFASYLALKGRLKNYQVKAIWWGKVTTALQFIFLLWLVLVGPIHSGYYIPFFIFGCLAFRELILDDRLRNKGGEKI